LVDPRPEIYDGLRNDCHGNSLDERIDICHDGAHDSCMAITRELRSAAQSVAYSDECESAGDFRYGMEVLHPEIELDDIRTLWSLALQGQL
jgi:hypothetical protein